MVMATVTPVTVLAPPVLSRGHIVNVITVNVKRATFIVKDMAMVVLPEMLVADWHLASSELGSSRIPTVWQDLAHSTTQICHTECATQ